MEERVPLTTLMSWAWIALTIEADNAFEAACTPRVGRLFRISFSMWANGLLHVDESGVTVEQLRGRARAACNLGGLERWGWITIGEPGNTRRPGYGTSRGIKSDTLVRPTRAGSFARRVWPEVVADTEQRWRGRYGAGLIDESRALLTGVAPAMPWSLPEVHPSDGFRTHVIAGEGTTEGRPLIAVLGQALTAMTLDHEKETRTSLPLAANTLRVIAHDTVRIRDLPERSGLAKEGVAMAVGFLGRHDLAVSEADRTIRLTVGGLARLDRYRHLVLEADNPPLRQVLGRILGNSKSLAEGLTPPDGGWRSQKPHLTRTNRMLSDPTGSLPWHPLVLHRGGWPDAS